MTKGARGDLGWTFQLLTALTSTLAIVALARHAFATWSLSAPMALVMDAYNATMQVLFGWAHPYLQAALTWLGSFIGWRPTLYPHWRDVFVLLTLWSGAGMRALRAAFPERRSDNQLVKTVVFGSILALLSSTQPSFDVRFWAAVVITLGTLMALTGLSPREWFGRRFFTMFGLSIISGFLGAFCFFAIDAGLKLAMP
jgi:hypothetical protein